MKVIRDIWMQVVYYSGLAWLRFQARRLFLGPQVRILTYHDVPAEHAEGLMQQLQTYQKKFHILTPTAFEEKNFVNKKVNLLITFDDGYQNWVDVVLPVLNKLEIKALFFVNSGFVHCAGTVEKAKIFAKEQLRRDETVTPISWNGVRELVRAGHTIGGHTMNHVFLNTDDEVFLTKEIENDKKVIEKEIDREITHFAYPFGRRQDRSNFAIDRVKRAGYQYGYAIHFGFNSKKTNVYQFSRDAFDPAVSPRIATMWLAGAYDWLKSLVGYKIN